MPPDAPVSAVWRRNRRRRRRRIQSRSPRDASGSLRRLRQGHHSAIRAARRPPGLLQRLLQSTRRWSLHAPVLGRNHEGGGKPPPSNTLSPIRFRHLPRGSVAAPVTPSLGCCFSVPSTGVLQLRDAEYHGEGLAVDYYAALGGYVHVVRYGVVLASPIPL